MRALNENQFAVLYRHCIAADFPPNERRPLHSIRALWRGGHYSCHTLWAAKKLQAYACFIASPNAGGALLDYYAVHPGARGGGIGSAFLAQLQRRCPASGLIIESEMPGAGHTPEENEVMARRIAFYTRLGAQMSRTGASLFGVSYHLLWLPVRRPLHEPTLLADFLHLYRLAIPPPVFHAALRVFPLPKTPPGGGIA